MIEYEIYFDHDNVKGTGAGGIIRNGEDYAGFWIVDGELTDYDGVPILNKNACRALESAGFVVPFEFTPEA